MFLIIAAGAFESFRSYSMIARQFSSAPDGRNQKLPRPFCRQRMSYLQRCSDRAISLLSVLMSCVMLYVGPPTCGSSVAMFQV